MTVLYAQDLEPEGYLEIVRQIIWPQDSLLLAFSPAQACLSLFSFDEAFLRVSEQGIIFGPFGELRWRRLDGQVRTVYLGQPLPSLVLEDYSDQLAFLHPRLRNLILWGIRTDLQDEWIEQQVPHRFVYPISGRSFSRGRVELIVEEWLDDHDMPHFSRYHSLKEIKGDYHAPR